MVSERTNLSSERADDGQAGGAILPVADAIEPLPPDLLDDKFGPLADISDEFSSLGEAVAPASGESVTRAQLRLARSIFGLGLVVTALLVVQTLYLLRSAPAGLVSSQVPATAPDSRIERLLRTSLEQVDQGFYQDVVDQLGVLEETVGELTKEQRFRLFSTLSLAHRRLNQMDEAADYTSRATAQFLENESVSGLLLDAQKLRTAERFDEARRIYARILVREDSLEGGDRAMATLARLRLADCYLGEARARPEVVLLPGLPADAPGEGEQP
jgi:hypothetical protein